MDRIIVEEESPGRYRKAINIVYTAYAQIIVEIILL